MPRPLAVALLAALLAGCAAAPPAPDTPAAPSFEAAVARHLGAIAGRDLSALLATVTETDDLVVIFPNGGIVEGREAYEAFHREWFADGSWAITFERVSTTESATMATALVRWTLTDSTPRSGRQALLSLTFRLEGGAWRLVHDQNTALELAFDAGAARAQIEGLNRRFGEGFRAGDADRIASLYTDDAVFLEPDASRRDGRGAIAAYWRASLAFIADMELTTHTLDGTREVLYETGTVATTVETPDGRFVQRDKYTNVWRLQPDGSYRIAVDMWNGTAAPQD